MAPSKYKIHDLFEGWLFEKLFEECSKKHQCWAEHKEFERKIFFLCLSSDSETDQIWKTYTPHALGVCIKLDVSKLKEKFDDSFILGSVKYRTIGTIQKELINQYSSLENITKEEMIDLFYWKMKGFKTDNEIRLSIIGEKNKDDTYYVDFDYHYLIESFLFDPRMEETTFESFRLVLTDQFGIDNKKIKHSTLHRPWDRFCFSDVDYLIKYLSKGVHSFDWLREKPIFEKYTDEQFESIILSNSKYFRKVKIIRHDDSGNRLIPGKDGIKLTQEAVKKINEEA